MGLDIYAGTLTRYYSHNWKTVTQQWAEENEWGFQKITPDGEPADNEEELSPAEVLAAVENWRDQILSAISQRPKARKVMPTRMGIVHNIFFAV